LLIDEQTNGIIAAAGLTTEALEPRQVKGVARPVPVFDVIDDEHGPDTADILAPLR
jgi:class 3 adenylate cyclase